MSKEDMKPPIPVWWPLFLVIRFHQPKKIGDIPPPPPWHQCPPVPGPMIYSNHPPIFYMEFSTWSILSANFSNLSPLPWRANYATRNIRRTPVLLSANMDFPTTTSNLNEAVPGVACTRHLGDREPAWSLQRGSHTVGLTQSKTTHPDILLGLLMQCLSTISQQFYEFALSLWFKLEAES